MPLPHTFLDHLRQSGYDSRSNKHSNALALAVLDDLISSCPAIAAQGAAGALVYQLNMKLRFGASDWNVDFVLGQPGTPTAPPDGRIATQTPSFVRLALEIKSVMGSHRNAIQNRKRDFEAHHEHVHNYNRRSVAAGLLVLNANSRFESSVRTSPVRPSAPEVHARTLDFCVHQMRSVTSSGGANHYGMDAKGLILLNLLNKSGAGTTYVVAAPAPQPGDPLHYDSFIRKLCEEYTARFA
jgi:hypothetical protein